MNKQEIIQIIKDFRYKPGFSIEVFNGKYENDLNLMFTYRTIDADDFNKPFRLSSPIVVDVLYFQTREMFINFLFSEIVKLERHEVGEFFRIGNERPFDPHAN